MCTLGILGRHGLESSFSKPSDLTLNHKPMNGWYVQRAAFEWYSVILKAHITLLKPFETTNNHQPSVGWFLPPEKCWMNQHEPVRFAFSFSFSNSMAFCSFSSAAAFSFASFAGSFKSLGRGASLFTFLDDKVATAGLIKMFIWKLIILASSDETEKHSFAFEMKPANGCESQANWNRAGTWFDFKSMQRMLSQNQWDNHPKQELNMTPQHFSSTSDLNPKKLLNDLNVSCGFLWQTYAKMVILRSLCFPTRNASGE